MSFLDRLLGRAEPNSRQIAKERLQIVLTTDRTNISPAVLEMMKDDIINSISKHVEIDRAGIQLNVSNDRGSQRVVADIPVIRARATTGPARETSSTTHPNTSHALPRKQRNRG